MNQGHITQITSVSHVLENPPGAIAFSENTPVSFLELLNFVWKVYCIGFLGLVHDRVSAFLSEHSSKGKSSIVLGELRKYM